MLPEVARQTGDLLAELQIEANAAVADGEPRLARAMLQGIVVGGELELREQLREAVQLLLRQPEDLADLARGGASPVRDHVGGHRRTRRAVALVDVLDHLLALVAAREIEIDVRPRLVPGRVGALFGEEALEEQVHLHRIDGGDPERVADRAVGRRAAPLHEHVLAPAEQDDVVDDEEVPGEAEPGDERQLPLELRARPGPARATRATGPARATRAAVAPAGAVHGPMPQLAVPRLRVQELRLGELVAEIVERVGAALGDLARQPHRFRQIAELRGDLARGAYVPLGIAREAPARFIQRGLQADASERVEQRLPAWRSMAAARAGDDAHAARSRRVDPVAVLALLPRVKVPAHFREQPLGPEVRCEDHQLLRRARAQRDQALPEVGELRGRDAARFLASFRVPERQQAAEVLVSATVFAEQRDPAATLYVDLGADQRAHALAASDGVEARDAVETADVRQPEDAVSLGCGGMGQVFRQRGAAQEREGAAGVQLDILRVVGAGAEGGAVGPVCLSVSARLLVAGEYAEWRERGSRSGCLHQVVLRERRELRLRRPAGGDGELDGAVFVSHRPPRSARFRWPARGPHGPKVLRTAPGRMRRARSGRPSTTPRPCAMVRRSPLPARPEHPRRSPAAGRQNRRTAPPQSAAAGASAPPARSREGQALESGAAEVARTCRIRRRTASSGPALAAGRRARGRPAPTAAPPPWRAG